MRAGSPATAYEVTYSYVGQPLGSDESGGRNFTFQVYFRPDELVPEVRRAITEKKLNRADFAGYFKMDTSVYATGRALYALQVAGVPASNTPFERGVQYLLNRQQEDGSWFVQSRALAFQPYFDAGFPHGYNQWISAAGTSWAAIALSYASASAATAVAGR